MENIEIGKQLLESVKEQYKEAVDKFEDLNLKKEESLTRYRIYHDTIEKVLQQEVDPAVKRTLEGRKRMLVSIINDYDSDVEKQRIEVETTAAIILELEKQLKQQQSQ